jgi:pyruvate,water dikinase
MHHQLILPLDDAEATAELVGGKGAALARLAAAGLPAPPGFRITTAAYRRFVEANDLQAAIGAAVAALSNDDPASEERAAERIRALIEAGALPTEVGAAIEEAYSALGEPELAVAVRSSATAEDLPGASFAGQLETSLNVRGAAAVLAAVRRCWASLWSARALAYRARLGIRSDEVAMGVVVQSMVLADVAGVLFTANPTTGERDELIVNASFGLGEAIVGGAVTPDTYVLDRTSLDLKHVALGAKAAMIAPADGGGTVVQAVPDVRRHEQALSGRSLRELAELGVRIEELFDGIPQDIEWAVAGDTC